ncbi:RNA polymerase sigma-70 factor, ECF subfamily [Micromonospora pattaloongensis]|uniref:RNA polymerase sigma-70 factor, ECF subfamily n=1 Tax=Micromonospora pattaloongensis TaxID=405436 RepID=A0A1H3NYB8_9ACTN|nr:RNA polymerase sigma factor [Micromonospora pattaloongensis]SDY93710.1 RNA polymerase sigma-70 factor, ECF subfamily [Micromonospora pattaloongensis]
MTDVITGPTDATIIAESLQHPDRFAALYERHATALYGYAYRRLGREFAEDVVAETFIAAFRGRSGYDVERVDARPWLFAIINREIARHHRTERARYRTLQRVKHEHGEESLADRVAGAASAEAWRDPLANALAKLSRKDRDVLLLIAWGGLSYDEVAQALQVPVGTVRSRLNRARRKLREALPDYSSREPR